MDFFEPPAPADKRTFISFVVFEPASQRIEETDVLLKGDEIRALFDQIYHQVSRGDSLQEQTIYNRFARLKMMLDLVKPTDEILITKFLNKVWRRHAFFSNLGELFLTLGDLSHYDTSYDIEDEALILPRMIKQDTLADLIDSESSKDEDEDEDNEDDSEEKKAD